MKKILLIDDLRDFRSLPENSEVVIARNSEQALDILQSDSVWDEVWLDHDLGEVDGSLDTIMPVIDFLSERAFFDDSVDVGTFYIHTSNPVGRKQMKTSLDRYGYFSVMVEASTFFIVNND